MRFFPIHHRKINVILSGVALALFAHANQFLKDTEHMDANNTQDMTEFLFYMKRVSAPRLMLWSIIGAALNLTLDYVAGDQINRYFQR